MKNETGSRTESVLHKCMHNAEYIAELQQKHTPTAVQVLTEVNLLHTYSNVNDISSKV